jgi:hypothetical protein
VKIPKRWKPDGRSFFPQLIGEKGNPRDYYYSWYARKAKTVFEFASTAAGALDQYQNAHTGEAGQEEQVRALPGPEEPKGQEMALTASVGGALVVAVVAGGFLWIGTRRRARPTHRECFVSPSRLRGNRTAGAPCRF